MGGRLTREQIAKAFVAIIGRQPREADYAVIEMMGATPDVLAEYLWDHWMGEPDEPTEDAVLDTINEVLKQEGGEKR